MKKFNLHNLNGTNGFTIKGIKTITEQQSGQALAIGDVNGDGLGDVIVGASMGYPNQGHVYVIFGSAVPFKANFDLSSLNGINGFTITTNIHNSNLGYAVSATDLNKDGFDDIVIGAPADSSGGMVTSKAFVVLGHNKTWHPTFDVSSLNGTNGFTMTGKQNVNTIGAAVSNAGDVNKDGINDIIISGGTSWTGASAFVLFGSKVIFNSTIALNDLDGKNGFKITAGEYTNNKYNIAASVDRAGDFNDDDIDDIMIGAPSHYSEVPGKVFIIFGKKSFSSSLNLDAITATQGLYFSATNNHLGYSVSYLGDINKDGVADIGMSEYDQNPGLRYASGNSYVAFGGSHFTHTFFNLTSLNGINGFTVNVNSSEYNGGGCLIKGIGYFNSDNIADFAIGIPTYATDNNGNSKGMTFFVYGQTNFPAKISLPQMHGVNGEAILPPANIQGQLGTAIAGMADINNDNRTDVVVGAPMANQEVGATYAIFGSGNINPVTHAPVTTTVETTTTPNTAIPTETSTIAPHTSPIPSDNPSSHHPTTTPNTAVPIGTSTTAPHISPIPSDNPAPNHDYTTIYIAAGGAAAAGVLILGVVIYAKVNSMCCFGGQHVADDGYSLVTN